MRCKMVSIGKEMRMARLFSENGKALLNPGSLRTHSAREDRTWDETAKLIIKGGRGYQPGHALVLGPEQVKIYHKVIAGKIPYQCN